MEIHAPTEALRLFVFHLAQEMLLDKNSSGKLRLTVSSADDTVTAVISDECHTVTATASKTIHHSHQRAEHVACAKAAFRLFAHLGGRIPPYGTLVGVRPVKMALYYLNRGASEAEVCNVLTDEYNVLPEKAALLYRLAQTESACERSLQSGDSLLYLSIPYCPSRCRYCSFISHSAPQQLRRLPDYLDRMDEELIETAKLFQHTERRLRAVYIGGGTPGVLNPQQLSDLLSRIRTSFAIVPEAEFTVELGRPDTITEEKCRVLSEHGVQRICINPQSLSDTVLSANGRSHTADDFYRAFSAARKCRIPSINTDLIAGLSTDTPDGFLQSLEGILELSPENITIHALCKKRASEEDREIPREQDENWAQSISLAYKRCINANFEPYYLYRQKNTIANLENLGYAKPGHACLYNIAMMEDLCDVFAVGAGAMTKLRLPTEDGYKMLRLPSYKYPEEYLTNPEKGRKNRQQAAKFITENEL